MAVRSHQYFSLRWNNYQSTMTSVFQQLREDQSFVDVTLACENGSLKAHKVVLSACSSYFQKLLLDNPCKHPTIILPSDIIYNDLKTIIDFVYRGEIDVTESELQGLLRTAEQLKIKGLCETAETVDEVATDSTSTTTATITVPESTTIPLSSNVTNLTGNLSHTQNNNVQRKTRVRKRSKSPDNNCNTSIIGNTNQTYNTGTIVNLNPNQSSGSSTITSAAQVTGCASASSTTTTAVLTHFKTEHQEQLGNHTVDSISSDNSVSKAKICKTEDSSNNGGGVVAPGTAIVTQIVVARDSKDKNMTSLGMGMNGGLLGVPMGFLDFTPEPPAPSATPVTEHVDMSCTPSTDTRDLSNPTETLDIDNQIAQHIIQRLDQSPMHQIQHQTSVDDNKLNLIQNIKSEVVDVKQQHLQHQQHLHNQQQGQSHQQQTHHQDITGTTVMEIDPNNIKHEPGMIITPEIVTMMTTGHMDIYNSDTSEDSLMIANGSPNDNGEPHYTNLDQPNDEKGQANGPKTWTQHDMISALDALKNHRMSLTKASITYGIPSTTLWQRAHRMGIDTPKKEGTTKSWNEEALNNALEALRTGQISANKASKAYGIPSSTLYKIARREGIRLAAPFNAAPTTWTPEDLERALEAIRAGHTSVQKASTEFGIPTGTLYGRCKREGIELSRSNPTPWSEDAMNEALVAVRVGHMSINQAAIHFNLPYSSLYGRFKRGKYDTNATNTSANTSSSNANNSIEIIDHSPENSQFQYSPGPSNTQTHQQQQHQSQQQQQSHHQQIHIQQQSQSHAQHQQHHHQQQHLQQPQQQDVVTSSSQVHSQTGQIQQIYHHSTPERS